MRIGSSLLVIASNALVRAGLLLTCLAIGFASNAAPHKYRVRGDAEARELISRGGSLVADYESFQIIEVDPTAVSPAALSNAEPVDDSDEIELNAGRLNTRAPAIQSLRNVAPRSSGKQLHLVHFAGPVKPEWAAALAEQGVQLVSYIPHNAYLVYGDAPSLQRLQAWARGQQIVQWEGAYEDAYKIHPRARTVDEKGNPRVPTTDLFAVQLWEDADANAATVALIDQTRLQPVRRQFRSMNYLNLIVRLPPGQLDRIAAQPDVISIQPYAERHKLDERQGQIMAGNLAGDVPSGPGYLAWLASKGFSQEQFDASGLVVDVTDSGVDNGTLTPGHFALLRNGMPGQPSRIVYSRLEGTPNAGSTLQGCDGHGTINAHILSGDSAFSSGFPHSDQQGYAYGLGICPFVRIGSSVIFDPDNFTDPNYPNLQSRAYQAGGRISANSWGGDVAGVYDVDAQAYDALVRDAQPSGSAFAAAGNQQMVIVFAAGNAGPDAQSMDSPGSGKNVIAVGASESVRSISSANGGTQAGGDDGCTTTDTDANNIADIAGFSGRGPCADGRMKPDLVAPGTHITGGVAQSGQPTTAGVGAAIACYNGSGVCALPGSGTVGNANNFFPLSQQFYTVSSGTSHATPAVAGACALLRQYFINRGLPAPSPAMTKADLINSARYMDGVGANDTLWSASQGMGEIGLGVAFDEVPRILRDQNAADKFTASGQTRRITGVISDSSRPFRVTLAWTDAPGSTTGSAFNNDLDLTVTVGGITYKGNVFKGPFSMAGGIADTRNNVESVLLPAGISGSFAVTVTAANINSDGVPNEAPALDQDYALVIYNAVEATVPVLTLDGYTLMAENCAPPNGVIDPGETVTIGVVLKNSGLVDSANLVATLLATNGILFPPTPQAYGVVAVGGTATQAFTFVAGGACGQSLAPVFRIQDGDLNLGDLVGSLQLGIQSFTMSSFTNSGSLLVPASGTSGQASAYPSSINLSGLTGLVSKVTVTLPRVSHTYPDDLDILLVGPGGETVMLMSDAGGTGDLTNTSLTFDDAAAAALPDDGQIAAGTYRPTDFDLLSDAMPSPAPSGPFGHALAVFNGSNPNGTWKLYVNDDASGDTGSISQGWRMTVTTVTSECCSGMPAPQITSISVSGDGLTISWTAIAGRSYRVQSTSNLETGQWSDLVPDVQADSSIAVFNDSIAGSRFYRIIALP